MKVIITKSYQIIILSLLLNMACDISGIVNCQISGQIKLQGQIYNSKDKQGIPYATIMVKSTGRGSRADENGYYSIDLPSDSSTIVVSSVGYHSKTIKLNSSSPFFLFDVKLEEDIRSLDEVTVTTEKERIVRISENISAVKISPTLISKLPSMGEVDVLRSFQLLPGVSATNETSAGLFVRGGTPDQNLILFDGMTIYHVDHFYGFFSAFNANTIDDIELMKGGFPAKYVGRISSVMEITRKPADLRKLSGTATLSLLSFNGAIEVPVVKDKISLQFAARRSYTDIIRTGLYKKIFDLYSEDNSSQTSSRTGGMRMFQVQEQEPSFYFYDLNSKLTYKINKKNELTFSVYNGKDNLDNSTEAQTGFNFGRQASTTSSSTDLAGWGNTGVSSSWKEYWNEKFSTLILLSYSRYFSNRNQNNESSDSTGTVSMKMNTLENNNVNDLSVRIRNKWLLAPHNTVEFGLENTYNRINYSLVYNDTTTMVDKNTTGNQTSLYIQDRLILLRNIIDMNLGFRVTYQDITKEVYYEPRLSLSFQITKTLKLYSAFGKYNQLCTRVIREDVLQGSKDFWLLADGNTIPVSSATHYIAGASHEKGSFLFNMEAYFKDMKGLVEYTLRTTRSYRQAMAQKEYFFKGTGYAKGIEFLIQKKYGLNTGWISYTLSEVKYTFPDLNYGEPYYASQDQTHEIKVIYCRKIKNFDISATYVYATGKPYTAPENQYQITLLDGSVYNYIHISDKNSIRLPEYQKLDFACTYNWIGIKADKIISLSIFNVLNHKNIWYKKYEISEDNVTVTNVNYLGFTPNLSFTVNFK
jgi:ferric enterobactin receptor